MELNPYTETDLLRQLSGIPIPTGIEEALAARSGPSEPGQLLRVAWDNTTFLFLALSISGTTVDGWVADVITGTGRADLQEDEVSFGAPLAIESPVISLPAISFDIAVGTLSDSGRVTASEKLLELIDESKSATVPTSYVQPVDEVVTTFDRLRGGDGTISELLSVNGFTLPRLKATLGIDSQRAFAVLRGDEAMTPSQEETVAEAAGINILAVSGAAPRIPDELVNVLW